MWMDDPMVVRALELLRAAEEREAAMNEDDYRKLYDDRKEPFYLYCSRFRNKVQLLLDEEIEKAMSKYEKERLKHRPGYYDVIHPPSIAGFCGGVRTVTITSEIRTLLIQLSNLAPDQFNADTENQGANFVFDDLVKATHGLCAGSMHYITFQAKDGNYPFNSPTITFQAKVWDRIRKPPEVQSCFIKPT